MTFIFTLLFCNGATGLMLVSAGQGEEKGARGGIIFSSLTYLSSAFTKCTHIRVSCQVCRVIAAGVRARRTMPLIMLLSPPCQKRQNGSKAIRGRVSKQLTSFVCNHCQSQAL